MAGFKSEMGLLGLNQMSSADQRFLHNMKFHCQKRFALHTFKTDS